MNLKRRAVALSATMLAGTAMLTAASAAPANAADPLQFFKNGATTHCLDDNLHDGLRTIQCWPTSNPNYKYQRWYVHVWNDGTRRLMNYMTGRCLTGTATGVTVSACQTSKIQSWYRSGYGDGSIQLRNQQTNRCLDDSKDVHLRTNENCWNYLSKYRIYQSWY